MQSLHETGYKNTSLEQGFESYCAHEVYCYVTHRAVMKRAVNDDGHLTTLSLTTLRESAVAATRMDAAPANAHPYDPYACYVHVARTGWDMGQQLDYVASADEWQIQLQMGVLNPNLMQAIDIRRPASDETSVALSGSWGVQL